MARRVGRIAEIDTLEEFDALARAAAHMSGWRLQGIDLTQRSAALRSLDPAGSLFLGVGLRDDDSAWLRSRGALVFPEIPELPFDPYRSELYTPDELYEGLAERRYAGTPDARVYAWARQRADDPARALSRALHDQSIDAALDRWLVGRRCVGVMGGHAVERGGAAYRDAAAMGRALARLGFAVLTGGGPGAMEAANLGALAADADDAALDRALDAVARVPRYRPSVTRWAEAAFEARRELGAGGSSLGIPTWHYGHEPPNAFAAAQAKYFRNAIREDTLLSRAESGIVFLPGAAGTVQEIFQDACENYYASGDAVAPMLLHGSAHWTEQVPAWPLLRQLAAGRAMEQRVHLTDTVDDVVAVLAGP